MIFSNQELRRAISVPLTGDELSRHRADQPALEKRAAAMNLDDMVDSVLLCAQRAIAERVGPTYGAERLPAVVPATTAE